MALKRGEVWQVAGRDACSAAQRHGGNLAIGQSADAPAGDVEQGGSAAGIGGSERLWCCHEQLGECFLLRRQGTAKEFAPGNRANAKVFPCGEPRLQLGFR